MTLKINGNFYPRPLLIRNISMRNKQDRSKLGVGEGRGWGWLVVIFLGKLVIK